MPNRHLAKSPFFFNTCLGILLEKASGSPIQVSCSLFPGLSYTIGSMVTLAQIGPGERERDLLSLSPGLSCTIWSMVTLAQLGPGERERDMLSLSPGQSCTIGSMFTLGQLGPGKGGEESLLGIHLHSPVISLNIDVRGV